MGSTKNWKAYYLKDFGAHALVVHGEVKTTGLSYILPELLLHQRPSLNSNCLNILLANTGDSEYTEVREVFFPDADKIQLVQVYNENGVIEATLPVSASPDREPEDLLYGEFYDD